MHLARLVDALKPRLSHYAAVYAIEHSIFIFDARQARLFSIDIAPERCGNADPDEIAGLLDQLSLTSDRPVTEQISAYWSSQQTRQRSTRWALRFFVSEACNFGCGHCIQGVPATPGLKRHLDPAAIAAAFDAIPALAERLGIDGAPANIILFGGEPLMPPARQTVGEIVKHARDLELPIDCVTNGYRYGMFRETLGGTRCRFVVTIDGSREKHDIRRPLRSGSGTFDQVVVNVTRMLHDGHEVAVQSILSETNVSALHELNDLAERQGWTAFNGFRIRAGFEMFPDLTFGGEGAKISREDEVIAAEPQFVRDARLAEMLYDCTLKTSYAVVRAYHGLPASSASHGCSALQTQDLSFHPDGNIYVCREGITSGVNPAIARYLPRLSFNDANLALWQSHHPQTDGQCRACRYVPVCGGGCTIAHRSKPDSATGSKACPPFDASWRSTLGILAGAGQG